MDATVFGLKLDTSDDAYDIAQPLEAVTVVKGLDSDGEIHYWTAKTSSLTTIEARGMLDWALEVARGA